MSSQRLRILLVSHGCPPESVGGVEQHVDGLARALIAAGHEVQVFSKTGRTGPSQGELIEDQGSPYPVTRVVYRYEGLDSLHSLYANEVTELALRHWLNDQHFDIAHVHHMTGLSTGILDIFAEMGLPCVMTLHDYWTICPRGQMWHRDGSTCTEVAPERCADCLRPAFGGWVPTGEEGAAITAKVHSHALNILSKPTRLIVPSARVTAPFEALGIPAERFHVVSNGVDTKALEGLPLADYDGSRPLRIGFMGTLIPSKGLDVLLRAFTQLPLGAACLRIHGNAVPYHGDESYLTRCFSLLDPDHDATYFGPYQTKDLPAILSEIDVLVAPALWHEAFGLTVREAQAAGRPIIVSRVGGLQDALGGESSGKVIEPGDVTALRVALQELIEEPKSLLAFARISRSKGTARGFHEMAADLISEYQAVISLDCE